MPFYVLKKPKEENRMQTMEIRFGNKIGEPEGG
jgi:hypothetical protein